MKTVCYLAEPLPKKQHIRPLREVRDQWAEISGELLSIERVNQIVVEALGKIRERILTREKESLLGEVGLTIGTPQKRKCDARGVIDDQGREYYSIRDAILRTGYTKSGIQKRLRAGYWRYVK